jgi:hypothetical protein
MVPDRFIGSLQSGGEHPLHFSDARKQSILLRSWYRLRYALSLGLFLLMDDRQRLARLNEAQFDSDSWKEWYRLTPIERMHESMKLWRFYLDAGGSLDPEPDSQSPFDAVMPHGTPPAYRRSGLRVVRRSGV